MCGAGTEPGSTVDSKSGLSDLAAGRDDLKRFAMPKAFIHIGTPKTGTSALQAFLRDQSEWLAERGVRVPAVGRETTGAHHALARALCGLPLPKQYFGLPEQARQELRTLADTDIIVSTEELSYLLKVPEMRARIVNFFRSCGFDPVILMYVGERLSNANSRYSQGVKTFNNVQSFGDFIRSDEMRDNFPHWRTLHAIPGVELVVRPYNAALRTSGIVRDFLKTIGLDDAPPAEPAVSNASPGPVAIGLCRWMGRALHERRIMPTTRQRNTLTQRLLAIAERKFPETEAYNGLTPELAQIIRADTRHAAESLAQTLWGSTWEAAFPETVDPLPPCNDIAVSEVHRPPLGVWRGMLEEAETTLSAVMGDPALTISPGVAPLRHAVAHLGVDMRAIDVAYRLRHSPDTEAG